MSAPKGKGKALTAKQRKFVEEYLKSHSAAEAYRKAYATKASPSVIATEAARLLRHPLIAPIISNAEKRATEATNRVIDQYEVTEARIKAELACIGFSNMLDYMRSGPDGDPYLDFSQLTREQAAALSEVTVEDFKEGRGKDARDVRRIKFKLHDKKSALELLGKPFGMFPSKVEHSGPNGGPIEHRDVSELSDEELAAIARRGPGGGGE